MKDFLQLAKDRFSARKFDGCEIPESDLEKILEAGIAAPTGVNAQPFKIWVFKSEEARKNLLSCTKMKFIEPAKVILAIGGKTDEAWTRPFDNKSFAEIDAAIVTTHMMLEIHDLGYGSTWIGHFDTNMLKEMYPEMQGYEMVGLLPISGIASDCVPSERHSMTKDRNELVKEL